MLSNIFSSFGVGSAKLDLILNQDIFYPGEEINGKIMVYGGNADQYIDQINLSFFTDVQDLGDQNRGDYDFNKTSKPKEIGFRKINEAFTIRANETKEINFSVLLPTNLPITIYNDATSVWIKSSLDIAYAKDPIDNDKINVYPAKATRELLEIMRKMGFSHMGTFVIDREDFEWGVAQIHKFFPDEKIQMKKRDKIDEVDLIIKNHFNKTLEVIVEKDLEFHTKLNNATGDNEIERRKRFYIELVNGRSSESQKVIQDKINNIIYSEEILIESISDIYDS